MEMKTAANPLFQYSHTIGAQALGPKGLNSPVQVARGSGRLLYVLNRPSENSPRGNWIAKCTIDDEYLGTFGAYGTEEGEFTWPNGLAVDQQGSVYITDEWLNRISVFDENGKLQHTWGREGDCSGQLNRPAGITFDSKGNLLVADSLNHRIQRFTKEGQFLYEWGCHGPGDGQLNAPWGITTDSQGNVFVADWRNDRVQKFNIDGKFLRKIGTSGIGNGEFHRPSGVGVDPEGYIYVVDWGNHRVQVFDPEGHYIAKFLGDAGISKRGKERMANVRAEAARAEIISAEHWGQERRFYGPVGISVDQESRIIVADSGRHRLQVYQKRPQKD